MASLIRQYAAADAAGRVKLIYCNFATFLGIIDTRVEDLLYMIENEKSFNRREELGDLGVRVQKSGISDITGNTATSNVMTRDALIGCDFSSGVLDGTDRGEAFKKEALIIKQMRKDYELFNNQLNCLVPKDREMLLKYIEAHEPIANIADEKGIAVDSARKYIFRIKQMITKQMVECMEGKI